MMGDQSIDPRPWARRDAFVIISVAVVLAALLQAIVVRPTDEASWWILGAILLGYGFVAFVFFDGLAWLVARFSEWKIRRHIRNHRLIVDDLLSIIDEYGEVFGSGGRFNTSGNSLLQAWFAKNGANPGLFTAAEGVASDRAHAQLIAWSNGAAGWTQTRDLLKWKIGQGAYIDSFEYYFVANILADDISKSLMSATNLVYEIRRSGLSKLDDSIYDDWDRFAKPVHALVDRANAVGRRSPSEAGVEVKLKFSYVPDLAPKPGEPKPPEPPEKGKVVVPDPPDLVPKPGGAKPPEPTDNGKLVIPGPPDPPNPPNPANPPNPPKD